MLRSLTQRVHLSLVRRGQRSLVVAFPTVVAWAVARDPQGPL
jgi:hypothetical protein